MSPAFDRHSADALAAEHLGSLRTKLGGPHIAHARRLAEQVDGSDERVVIAALLHDVVEKTSLTLQELGERVDDPDVVAFVEVLTQQPGEPEEEYLARCCRHPATLLLKRLDLLDKLTSPDVEVDEATAASVRAAATARLARLDALAASRGMTTR